MSGGLYEGGGAGGAGGGVNIAASDTTYTSGTVVLSGQANITVATNGDTILFSGGAGGAFAAGVSTGGNTSGTTGTVSNQVVLVGGNNVTLSQSTAVGGATITVSVPNTASQTVQTQNLHNVTLSGNTAGVMAEISSGTLTLAGGNNVTLSQNGNAVTISAGTGAGGFAGGGISGGNTSGDTGSVTGRLIFAGGNNVTLSGSTNGGSQTITISGPNTVAQSDQTQKNIQSIAASDTTYHTGQVQFTGSNMVTVKSSANQRVVIDATQTVQTQSRFNLTLDGNTSGALADVSSGVLTLAGGNGITLSQNGNAVTISGGGGGAAPAKPIHFFPEYPYASVITPATALDKLPFYFPTEVDGKITLNKILFPMSKIAGATSDAFTVHFGVYTISNGTRMALLGSASDVFSGSNTGSLSNKRWFCLTSPGTVNAISTLSEGNYIYGMYFSVNGGNTASMHYSLMGVQTQVQDYPGIVFPGSDQQSTQVSVPYLPFYGRHSVTQAGLPANVAQSDIVALGAAGSQARIHPLLIIRSF